MARICVYTCITGNYDNVNEIANKEKGIDYYLFTNNKSIKSNTWKVIYLKDKKLDDHRLSRKIKSLGHPSINDYDILVWIDACVVFQKSIKEFIKTYLKRAPFAAFRHFERDCIYDEAIECIRLKKDTKKDILRQVEFLRKEGYPAHNGLLEMTVFIRRQNNPVVQKTMKDWFKMIRKYSKRDQLSFMYCAWKNKLQFNTIPLIVWKNDWFETKQHNYKEKLTTCRIYYGEEKTFDYKYDDQPEYVVDGNKYSVVSTVVEDTNSIAIEATDIPAMEYKNLNITGIEVKNLEFINTIDFGDKKIVFAQHGIIKIEGDFKKGEQLKLEFEARKLEQAKLYELIEFLSVQNKELSDNLNSHIKMLHAIENSRSWKITKPLRAIMNRKSRKRIGGVKNAKK